MGTKSEVTQLRKNLKTLKSIHCVIKSDEELNISTLTDKPGKKTVPAEQLKPVSTSSSAIVPFPIPSSLFLLTDNDRFGCISDNGLIRDIISNDLNARLLNPSDHTKSGQKIMSTNNSLRLSNDLALWVEIPPSNDIPSVIFADPIFGITILCDF